jgi:L-threonylcarbamoyladenylate synthase
LTARLVQPAGEGLQLAMRVLEQGGLVAFPTDTLYALGCAATDPAALALFHEVKQRPPGQPAVLLSHNLGTLRHWVKFKDAALRQAERFWPGPLTMVLPLNGRALARMPLRDRSALGALSREGTVAVRIPDHAVAYDLLYAWGMPLCTSSANRSGDAPPRNGAQCLESLAGAEVLVIDGECPLGEASSILDLTSSPPRVLREGAIPAERLLS